MKNLISVILCLTSLSLNANNISWSELIPSKRTGPQPIIISQNDNYVYLLRTLKRNIYIDEYNIDDLYRTHSKEIILEYKNETLIFLNSYEFGKKLILLSTNYNKKNKQYYFFLHELNRSNLQLSLPKPIGSCYLSEKIDVQRNKTLKFSGFNELDGAGITHYYIPFFLLYSNSLARKFHISSNSKLGYFIYPKNSKANKNSKSAQGLLFESSLENLIENEIQLPYPDQEFMMIKSELGNNGIFYLLGYNLLEDKSPMPNIVKLNSKVQDAWIIAINTKSNEIKKVKIDAAKNIQSISFTVASNNKICVMWLTKDIDDNITGLSNILFDEHLEKANSEHINFKDDFIKEHGTVYKKNREPKLINYHINQIIENENGDFTMLAENYYVIVKTYEGSQSQISQTSYHYHHNDIILINHDSIGQFKWKSVVKKRQVAFNDNGYHSSYFLINEDNHLNIIFNKVIAENFDESKTSTYTSNTALEKVSALQVKIDKNGNQKKSVFYRYDDTEKLKLVPRYFSYDSNKKRVNLYATMDKKGVKIGSMVLTQ